VGEVTFNGLQLVTSPGRVMTPRPSTEQLVAAARAHIGDGAARVVDVGTGSGAVAIAIATACPHAEVWATDTSADAVVLARANVCRHRLGDRVSVRHGDLLAPVVGLFDVIAANLPYVPASAAADYPELEVEPFDAVFAAGDGLEAYRRLVDAATTRLTDGGVLLLQLDRRLVAARRNELNALQAVLAASRPAHVPAAAVVEAIAGKAA
jgi:release factor glutamine methyltransferase